MGNTRPLTTTTYDPTTRAAAAIAGVLFLVATMTFMVGDTPIAEFFSSPAGAAGNGTLAAGVGLQVVCGLAGALPLLLIAKGFRRRGALAAPAPTPAVPVELVTA